MQNTMANFDKKIQERYYFGIGLTQHMHTKSVNESNLISDQLVT